MLMLSWPMIASQGFVVGPGTSAHRRPSALLGERLPVHHHGAVPSKPPLAICSAGSCASAGAASAIALTRAAANDVQRDMILTRSPPRLVAVTAGPTVTGFASG